MEKKKADLVAEIDARVRTGAEKRRVDAGMSGSHGDGGASESIRKLEGWLDGIEFASTGNTVIYADLVQTINNDADPEYHEYQRLKQKFEK
jgi:hypothetical protein